MSEIRNPSQNLAISALELIAKSGFFGHSELGHRHCTILANNTLEQLAKLTQEDLNKLSKCSECGLEFGRVISYTCPSPKCPTGLGPTTC